MPLHLVGVRHHSPACARLVRDVIRAVRPRFVLIEGPADFTPRLGELRLGHRTPLAIFTYHQDEDRSHASWTPFCDYSPEWVAIHEGAAAGADVRFIDLPGWHAAFGGIENRYGDHERRTAKYVETLCQKLGIDGLDALWDHLFEQPLATDVLAARLDAYFDSLRADDPGSERDAPREAFMARCIAWALAQPGDPEVVVVCGGYHAPALAHLVPEADASSWPDPPAAASGARHGSYLVSYSFRRLDSFVGYESGMPSPAFHQHVWEEGLAAAADRAMRTAVERLRARKQPCSAADLIAVATMAQGLARLRGHAVLARTDLLDAIAAALVKDSLDVPLPWTARGRIAAGTDPILVEVMLALCGEREGKLDRGTPRPPLVDDVLAELERLGLAPGPSPRAEKIDLATPEGRERSRTLHRLRVLRIPGFARRAGPQWATDPVLEERWEIKRDPDAESRVIEASQWGATLEGAAAARLAEALLEAGGDLAKITSLLGEATFVGIAALAERLLVEVAQGARTESRIGILGSALARLLGLFRHDTLLGAAHTPQVARILEAAFDRGLWLYEGLAGPDDPADDGQIRGALALRDVARHPDGLAVEPQRLTDLMARRAVDPTAPPAVRGAALGALWSLGAAGDPEAARAHACRAVLSASRPAQFGDFLAGLFALAREEVLAPSESTATVPGTSAVPGTSEVPGLLGTLDGIVGGMTREDFLVAVPSLRLAFSWFPPREKDAIAGELVRMHGQDPRAARSLRRLDAAAEAIAAGHALEATLDAIEARYGIGPAGGGR